jgi:hypothetical protein
VTATAIELGLNEDRPIAGFASRIEAAADVDESALAPRLQAAAAQLGTGIPGDQGATSDLFGRMIAWVRGRRMVEDLGQHAVEVPWLCLHVPPEGTARLKLTDREQGTTGFKFSLVGTGLGDGWTFGAQEQRDFQERARCTAVVEVFDVHVRAYADDHQPEEIEYRSDVVGRAGTIVRELNLCPLCHPTADDEPVLALNAGPAVDLTADTVGQTLARELVLSGTSELELGLKGKLPGGIELAAGVTCRREVSSTCNVDYAFAGGRRYQPMRLMQLVDLPFWRVG